VAEVMFTGWGGHNQEAQARNWLQPFEAATGIRVNQATQSSYDELKRQVDSGDVTWDVIVMGNNFGLERDSRWLEPLPERVWQRTDIVPGLSTRLRVPDLVYSIVLNYRRDRVPRPLTSWADFFDPKTIPGKRVTAETLQYGLFEAALMADGVSEHELYPLDLDRAFAVIDRIRDELILMNDLEKASDVLHRGDAVAALYSANHAYLSRQKSDKVDIVWRQQILLCEFLGVARGAPHRQEAFALMDFILDAERQSALSRDLSYSPINVNATVDPAMEPHMTFSHRSATDTAFDDEWWSRNVDEVRARFDAWKASRGAGPQPGPA
jgi:putative spermidine/putrescine transport system substrate-binding protein